jgi:hypothetical protein
MGGAILDDTPSFAEGALRPAAATVTWRIGRKSFVGYRPFEAAAD